MRKLLHILFVTALALFSAVQIHSQQDYLASQYNFNSLMLNPAYAGAHPYLQTSTMYRNQWKVEGAPTTQIICADGRLKKVPIGLGFTFTSDKIGIVRERVISLDASYHFRTGWGKFSFGLRGGHVGYFAALDELVYWDEDDPIYNNGNIKEGFLTLGFGAFASSNSGKWFGGISIPEHYARDHTLRSAPETRFYKRHIYLYGGGILTFKNNLELKPSVLIRHMETNPMLMDMNLHVSVVDKESKGLQVWLGAGVRTNQSFLVSCEANLPNNLRVGYSFDVAGKGLYQNLGATHEIQIGFNFGGSTTIIQSPRYF
jgi:type IX secretion system PorP/SprF family membrane protein